MILDLSNLATEAPTLQPTKRCIVSFVGKFYDSLGLLAPVVVRFKIFLQELSIAKIGWDESLTGDLLLKWRRMSSGLSSHDPIVQAPRCYTTLVQEARSHKLCGFSDASLRAYAAVVYLRVESETGTQVSFIASKTRVSQLKQQSIPRLE